MDLKIASINVRGIGNNTKRREVFNWLRSKKLSIYMLQEVHCSENTADLWACEQKDEARNYMQIGYKLKTANLISLNSA